LTECTSYTYGTTREVYAVHHDGRSPMFHDRWLARAAAALYLVTWVTSVLALPLYGGSATDSTAGLASRASVLTASVLEVVLALAVVGTSLLLYPLLRPHGPAAAVGYIALRTLEASVILVGVVAVLPAVARPATTASPGLDPAVGAGLHLLHDWTFIVGPGLDRPGFSPDPPSGGGYSGASW